MTTQQITHPIFFPIHKGKQQPPKGKAGFVYIVHNIDKQKKYIGSKGFYTKTGNQTNWRTYTGSSKELNQDIKNGDRYVKSVLSIWTTKTDYLYEEIRQLVLTKAIESDWYYNDFLTRGINGRFLKEKH